MNSEFLFVKKCFNLRAVSIITIRNLTVQNITHPMKNVWLVLRNLLVVMKVSVSFVQQLFAKILINFICFLVNNTFATRLYNLNGYEIVLICDDSGSMNTPLSE